jgi:nucleoside-diphosphate-sugar epimerase
LNQPTLITGGAGFIGSNLADAIIANVPSLRVIDNLSSGSLENLKQLSRLQNFTFVRGDLQRWFDVKYKALRR